METRINKIFKPLYESSKRYYFLTGGRGSLKSTTVHDFVARLTYERGHGILFTRYTMTSAEKSIIPEFIISLTRNGAVDDFEITRDKITNKHTGSFILFSGIKTSSGNQTANLKSLAGITTWIIEEGEDFVDEKAFDDIDDSIRSNKVQNRVIWIQNPTTPEHFIYKRWILPKSKQIDVRGHKVTVSDLDEVEHIHTTYHIAEEYLSKSFLSKARKTEEENPRRYYHKYIGGWLEKAEGAIYENWEEGEFDNSLPFVYGMDFGFSPDPLAICKLAIDKNKKIVYLDEVLYKNEVGFDSMVNLLDSRIGRKNKIIADSAEKRTIIDLANNGFNIAPVKKYPGSIVDGIRKLYDYQLIITRNSTNLKTELNNYAWHDKKADVPIDKFNHLCDAFRYAFMYLELYKPISFTTF